MVSFESIYASAVLHRGGVDQVETSLPDIASEAKLRELADDRYLSAMSRRIFRAGLKHAMVDARWPAFEQAFYGFDPLRVAMLSDDELEGLMHNAAIIRHFGKIRAVRANAAWMLEITREFGSFGALVADWPVTAIVDLWRLLKKRGSQLGGQSGARFLRMVGKDTFLLTDDVVAVLKAHKLVNKLPASKKGLHEVQAVFNQWSAESGRCLAHVSRIVSFAANVDQ